MRHFEIVVDKKYDGLNPVQFGYEACAPAHAYGPAVRNHWLLHYVSSGSGRFEREGKRYNVKTGDIFVIPPEIETYYEADAVDPWTYIWVGFTCDSLPVELTPIMHTPKAGIVFERMKQCNELDAGKSAYLCGMLWRLMSTLLEQSNVERDESDYIEKALSYMNAEYINGVSVSEVANRLHINRCYFSSLFKKHMGISPQTYLQNLRLERAAELMLSAKSSPTTAAISSGYTDISQFSKIFKNKYGLSPRAYIEKYR